MYRFSRLKTQQLLSLKATVVTLLDSQFLKIFRKIQRTSVIGGFFSEQNLYGTDIRPGHGQPNLSKILMVKGVQNQGSLKNFVNVICTESVSPN